VFLSIGGGGFMAGVGAAFAARLPQTKVYGVETEGAGTMTAAFDKGEPVPIVPTSIVKTLGAPFATDRTFAAAKLFIKKILTVSDKAAIDGVFTLLATERVVCEPAAGCLLPAAQTEAASLSKDSRVCFILCGSNVDLMSLMREHGASERHSG
jgi:threonine dehydratase